MLDLDDIADVVASAVKASTAPLIDRLDAQAKLIGALEAREMPSAIKGEKGDPGEVDMDALRGIVDEMTQQAVSEQLPEALKAIPVPPAPEPIAPDMEAIEASIRECIAKAVAELPAAKDGENGIGLADALIDKDGNLVLTMTDGRTKALGLVVGKDGIDGKDGQAGAAFTLDDFDIIQEDERTFKFCFTHGGEMHSFEFALPVPIFKGAFKEGHDYTRGDMVVWGGSLWHANEDTKAKPDSPDSGWIIAARKGRDGKDAK